MFFVIPLFRGNGQRRYISIVAEKGEKKQPLLFFFDGVFYFSLRYVKFYKPLVYALILTDLYPFLREIFTIHLFMPLPIRMDAFCLSRPKCIRRFLLFRYRGI